MVLLNLCAQELVIKLLPAIYNLLNTQYDYLIRNKIILVPLIPVALIKSDIYATLTLSYRSVHYMSILNFFIFFCYV